MVFVDFTSPLFVEKKHQLMYIHSVDAYFKNMIFNIGSKGHLLLISAFMMLRNPITSSFLGVTFSIACLGCRDREIFFLQTAFTFTFFVY